jgi:hypothetical protein
VTENVDEQSPGDGHRELWLDRYAGYFGFDWLADRLPGSPPPSYVYAVTAVLGWVVVANGVRLYIGTPLLYEINPYFALQPFVLLFAVYGARTLDQSYSRVMDEMRIRDRAADPARLVDIVPSRLPWLLFGVAASVQLVRTVADFGVFKPVGLVANGLIFPFVYVPIIVQFCAIYLAIQVLAPWRLIQSDVGIHFLDPHGVGGMRPLGELIKTAYYFIAVGLVVYALITYAPILASPEWGVSVAAGTIFTSAWIATILTVAFAVFMLHRFMHREKREELQRLEDELRSYVENPWDVTAYSVPDEHRDRVDDIRDRMAQVSATREYPATFNIWSQLLLTIAIPKAIQLVLANV